MPLDLTEEEKTKLRDWVMAKDSYLLVDRLLDVMVDRYRDALETAHDDPRFYQGTLNGLRAIKTSLNTLGLPKQEYEASQEAFDHFRRASRKTVGLY